MPVALVTDYLPLPPARARGPLPAARGQPLRARRRQRTGARARSATTTPTSRVSRTATELPTTSQPSIGDFLAVYEPLIDSGHEIVSIHLSGGLSGTVRSAEQAREQLGEAAERVHVVDSATACGAEGLMLLAAAAAIRAGADAAAVVAARTGSACRAAVPVLARHARVPAQGRAHRRRSGLAGLGPQDQADPLTRVGDRRRRTRAHQPQGLRAPGGAARDR